MKYNSFTASLAVILVSAGAARSAVAPATGTATAPLLDPKTRSQVLEGIITRYRQTYVFPDVAQAMEKSLRERMRKGEYARITGPGAFAESLTVHLRAVSRDTHVEVHFSPAVLPPMAEDPQPETPADQQQRGHDLAWINNGFLKIERLKGNVGYLDLDSFVDPQFGGDTAVAAMNFLSNCDALIVDLRYNPGGNSRMVALICSYLFEEPVHLVDIYSRPADFTKQSWTSPISAGKHLAGVDVYVLTSKRTHSAAEEFAFDLQGLKRATIVGETTRGGAHPTGRYRITEHFAVAVPEGRSTSPITHKDWEGVGVTPDIAAPADDALKIAHRTALERLLQKNARPERAGDIQQVLAALPK